MGVGEWGGGGGCVCNGSRGGSKRGEGGEGGVRGGGNSLGLGGVGGAEGGVGGGGGGGCEGGSGGGMGGGCWKRGSRGGGERGGGRGGGDNHVFPHSSDELVPRLQFVHIFPARVFYLCGGGNQGGGGGGGGGRSGG
ncbi:hypothetical protein FKM82_025178 [Ascaphus truei]